MTENAPIAQRFYITAEGECSYLDGRSERKLFTYLTSRSAQFAHQFLAERGFRRSQTLIYRPTCDNCDACVSVRVLAQEFRPSRSFRRVANTNLDVIRSELFPIATEEHFVLFRAYLASRHQTGGMAEMDWSDYASMVEDTPVDTMLVEYRLTDEARTLVGVALTDRMTDGLSMVYSFYDPAMTHRSLGTFMVLDHINEARTMGAPHVYLGYWVAGSKKMDYKSKFEPMERLEGVDQWVPLRRKE